MKAKTKAAKRRARKGRTSVRAMSQRWESEQRETPRKPQEDPRVVALSARCRAVGIADNRTNRARIDWLPMHHPAAATIIGHPDRDDLWKAFDELDLAHEVYHRRIIGKRRFPAVSKVEMMPDRVETRDDDRPDFRTEAQKDADARAAWGWWLCRLVETGGRRITLHRMLWREGVLKHDVVDALTILRDVVDVARKTR